MIKAEITFIVRCSCGQELDAEAKDYNGILEITIGQACDKCIESELEKREEIIKDHTLSEIRNFLDNKDN